MSFVCRVIVAGVLGLISTVVLVEMRGKQVAYSGACRATVKTLAGAMEMYSLDNGKVLPPLSSKLVDELVAAGYLRSRPGHVGSAEEEPFPWISVPVEPGVACRIHGLPGPFQGAPAREQLVRHGVNDPAILDQFLETQPPAPVRPRTDGEVKRERLWLIGMLFLVTWTIQPLRRRPEETPVPV